MQGINTNNSGFFGSIPTVTKNILIINILVWLAQFLMLKNGIDLSKYLGLYYIESDHFMPHQLFTYMFMHSPHGFSHVFFNMFAVFMFGRTLETVWGPKRFLTYYIITGLGAAALQLIITFIQFNGISGELSSEVLHKIAMEGKSVIDSGMNYQDAAMAKANALLNIPMVGASGAVFGILLAFGMLFPNSELFIIPFPFPIKAKYFVVGYGILELTLGIADRAGDNTAHFAHLGGLLTGIILILYWRQKAKSNGQFF